FALPLSRAPLFLVCTLPHPFPSFSRSPRFWPYYSRFWPYYSRFWPYCSPFWTYYGFTPSALSCLSMHLWPYGRIILHPMSRVIPSYTPSYTPYVPKKARPYAQNPYFGLFATI